ncbi:MAG: type I methionyl aminopeptidase [Pseudomonadota bacterium]
MITLKSPQELEKMRRAGRIVAEVLLMLREHVKPGVSTMDLERMAMELIVSKGAKAAFPMVPGYKHALCTSINEAVVHGIPNSKRKLNEGDVLSIDCGVFIDGFFGDHAWTFPVGKVSSEKERLLKVGEEALSKGIDECLAGKRLFDISAAIQKHAEGSGYSVVRDYVGHGIGRELHEDPQVPNFGIPDTGIQLKAGMVLALEPMVNMGSYDVDVLDDGWTVVTRDRKPSVHFEHMVAIKEDGSEILSSL